MFLLFLLIWVALIIFLIIKKKQAMTKPFVWMLIGWVFLLGLYLTSGIAYKNSPSLATMVYFVIFLFVFGFGCFFGCGKKKNVEQNECGYLLKSEKAYDSIFLLLFLLETASFFVFVIDFSMYNSFLSSSSHTESRLDKIGVIAEIICLSGLLYWLRSLYLSVSQHKKIDIKSFIALFYYLFPGFAISGRQSFLIAIVSTIVCYCFASQFSISTVKSKKQILKYRLRIAIFSIVGISAAVLFFAFIAENREASDSKIELYEYMFNCSFSVETKRVLDSCGPFKIFILETISYYSHELSQIQLILNNWDGSYYLGASQFQLISSNLPLDSFFNINNIQFKMDSIAAADGSYSHVWRTIVINCFIDYGLFGGLVFIFVIGIICGKIYKYSTEKRNSFGAILLSLICSGSFFSIQYSPFVENYWYFPVLFIIALAVIRKSNKRCIAVKKMEIIK